MPDGQPSALMIGAHLDDCEAGLGGVSCRLAREGWRVVFLNTIGDVSALPAFASKERADEFHRQAVTAALLLGAEKIFLNYQHNLLHQTDPRVVSDIAGVIQRINPTLVFIPWPDDHHYDHSRTSRAAMEALSYTNRMAAGKPVEPQLREILAYEISSWQTRDFTPDFYLNVAPDIDTVLAAMNTFRVFNEATLRHYTDEMRYRRQSWGVSAYYPYAEGFKHLGPEFPIRSLLPGLLAADLRPAGSIQYPWGGRYFR